MPPTEVNVKNNQKSKSWFYISVRQKFVIAILFACLWTWFSLWMAESWIHDLSTLIGEIPALFFIYGCKPKIEMSGFSKVKMSAFRICTFAI
ncbi:hypothetical protein M0D70_14215, partial [Acinetobacter portensis]|nr:hypothetical protein [Acinetobacter portensis]MCK7641265.1 hypothetical protein [Acinetobacter portensis]